MSLALLKSRWAVVLSGLFLKTFVIALSVSAQNIPDINFANAIRSTCPTCIDASNNLLPAAASLTTLDVSGKNIADLTGIEGFTSLLYLYCNNNQLTKLPALPSNLSWLFCNNNQLTSLPNLPNSITVVYCNSNQITDLPVLSSALIRLVCDNNKLVTLPNLPNSLVELHCENNLITNLPNLTFLRRLFCSNNQLVDLPILPDRLLILRCSNNKLTFLPPLPNTLFELYCDNNIITSLPSLQNVSNLYWLNCTNNQLKSIPPLPYNLELLYCHQNQITCLPLLPNSLDRLQLDADKITCLPNEVVGLKVYDINSMLIATPPLCPSAIAHSTGNLSTGTYVATQTITSAASLSLGSTNYHTSRSITLNSGFQAGSNRIFSAEIRGCK